MKKMLKIILALTVIVLAAGTARADLYNVNHATTPHDQPAAINPNDKIYLDMVADARKHMALDFDFKRVRKLYTTTSFFNPDITPRTDIRDYVNRSLSGDRKVPAELNDYLAQNFALPEVHFQIIPYLQKFTNDGSEKDFHVWAHTQLMLAIHDSGNGTKEHPYAVLNKSEEKLVATEANFDVQGADVDTTGAKPLDVLHCVDMGTNKPQDLYFDFTLAKVPDTGGLNTLKR